MTRRRIPDVEAPDVKIPQLPLRPGRGAFSKRTRLVLAIALAAALSVAVVVAAVVSTRSAGPQGRLVTIPLADRAASGALLRAAEAVNFHPLGLSAGVGKVESRPAAEAPAVPSGLLPVGSAAPGFVLRTPTGSAVSAASLRGRAVLVEFFATWCPHCAAEASHLQDIFASLSKAKVAFVGIDADGEDAPSVLAFHIYFGLQFPALLDPSGRPVSFPNHGSPGAVSNAYRVTTFPTFYVLDPRGRVVWRSSGEQPDATLRRELRLAAGGTGAVTAGHGAAGGCVAAKPACARP